MVLPWLSSVAEECEVDTRLLTCCLFADLTQENSNLTDEKVAGAAQLQDTLQQLAALQVQLETAQRASSELEVSLVVHDIAKNVCDADYQDEIAKLTIQLDDGAKELATTKASFQAMSDDREQQDVQR